MDDLEVIGDWVRERVLGCGGFGIVVLWKNTKNNERIAIKKYREGNNKLTQKHRERWTHEVDMMKKIRNDNIVCFKILPAELEETLNKYNPMNLPMLSMEFCSKGDLRSVLFRSENCCGLPESDVRYILKDLMNAVSYLHTLKITHRDLKPENIVLQTSDRANGIIYKLIDLGYAKEIDAKSICASFVGTLQYLAPELLYSKSYSCSVDYWSMGLVAFEVICGTRPFLPNKSPAQWMFHVHKKTFDVISIHQLDETEESITSYKEIFRETHISSCLKSYMKSWLQLALEYNPRKRGYTNYDPDSTQNSLDIFTNLESLLKTKIITVFSVYTYEFCSYEIDDCTRVETVQGWIERDTKIKKDEQVLLSYNCDNIEVDGLATQFFDETYKEPMLFVFKKTEILPLELKVKYCPDIVQKILNSTTNLQYYFQKRCYAHCLYFIYSIVNTYNTILEASSLRIKKILKICDEISHKCRTMNINIEKLSAQKEFSKIMLDFDYEEYLKHFSQNATHWMNSYDMINNKIDRLFDGCNTITIRHESAFRRATNLSVSFSKEFSKHNEHELNKLLEDGIECFTLVKTRSKDKRTKPENCKNMAKIVYNVLKFRDILLRNTAFRNYLQMIVDIEHELDKMASPLNSAIDHIEKFKKELITDHLNRQTKIWEFTIKQKPKKETEQKPNFIIGNPNRNDDIGSPISLSKPLHFILGDTSNKKTNSSLESNASFYSANENSLENVPNKKENDSMITKQINNNTQPKTMSIRIPQFEIGEPISNMIDYNMSLRHELQEKTDESFKNYKSILNEQLDFSFLNE